MLTVAAFYKFVTISDPVQTAIQLKEKLTELEVRGTLLVAPEGINGSLAGEVSAIHQIVDTLSARFDLPHSEIKFSETAVWPFKRLKVRLKKEIITFNQALANPSERVGTYLNSVQWNQLIGQSDVLLLDTRNQYETVLGHFDGAVIPPISHFSDFSAYVRTDLADKKAQKIAMYCTGGIRCEKASAFMLAEGFSEVYHLKGGILQYLRDMPSSQSRWQGKCFVFDDRGTVERS